MKKYLLVLFFISSTVLPQAGSFDATFDGDGINSNCLTLQNFSSMASAFQSTGKTVCFGFNYTGCGISLIRYNTNGSVDSSFGNNGSIENTVCSVFPNGGYYSSDMVIQSDDKIVVMGLQQNSTYPNAYWVARLNPDGDLDPTFNGTGYLDLSFGTANDRGTCIALQSDGKLLVGGSSGSTAQYFTVARLNTNGSLDTSFGNSGKVQTAFPGFESFANCITVQNDGKIILGGYTVNSPYAKDFAMIRYNSNGSIDTGFGTNGKVITTVDSSFSDIITRVIVRNDGRIIAGGYYNFESYSRLAMVQYLSNGAIDTSFGTNGKVLTENGSDNSDIALQTDGKIILVGGFDYDIFTVLRYQSNGVIDTTFGTNGLVTAFDNIGNKFAASVLIQSDNKIVVTGSIQNPAQPQSCPAIIRLDPGVLSNPSFDNSTVKLYPNPTKDIISFDNTPHQIEKVTVYNCLGQEVIKPLDCAQGDNPCINLSSLPNGVYLLQLEGSGVKSTQKVVKE